jgi:acyl-CoA thioesterase-1
MDLPSLRTMAAALALGVALPLMLVACTPAGAAADPTIGERTSAAVDPQNASSGAPATGSGNTPVRVVVIGDSLSTGFGTSAKQAWPSLLRSVHLSGKRPVRVTNAAENGSGYLAVGDDGDTFTMEVQASVTADADVVVFFGSDNDAGTDPAELREAATSAFAEASALAPNAKLLAVGPLSGSEEPDTVLTDVRDSDASAAQDQGVRFVDPIADQWLSGRADALLGPDGEHPSAKGQKFLRDKMKGILTSVLPT